MDIPFDRVVLYSPAPLELATDGKQTPVEAETFAHDLPAVVWEQMALAGRARRASVLFGPCYVSPLLARTPVVVANHGIYEGLPGEFSWLKRLRTSPLHRLSARRADRVIANSNCTKSDIVRYFGVSPERIDVVRPAAHDMFFSHHEPDDVAAEVRSVLGRSVPYLLFVGKLARRRNVPNLIEAFASVRRREALPHHLLIVGPDTSGVGVRELAARYDVGDVVSYVDHLESLPLARLYAGADLFVLPTTYEGISQTMFEAMASGTAVLTVEHPTLAEGGADDVFAVATPSVENLVLGMTKMLKDEHVRRDYAARGRTRSRLFSWKAVAESTAAILDQVAAPSDAGAR